MLHVDFYLISMKGVFGVSVGSFSAMRKSSGEVEEKTSDGTAVYS